MTRTHLIVLRALFELSSRGLAPDLCRLAQHAAVPLGETRRALMRLEQDGLVREHGLKLTLPGLAVVVGAGALTQVRSFARAA